MVNMVCGILLMLILVLSVPERFLYFSVSKYLTLGVFVIVISLFFVNVNFIHELKNKCVDLWILLISGILAPVFLWLADSRWGALLSVWNILLIFYLADKIALPRKSIFTIFGIQTIILLLFLVTYPKTYNPNYCGMYISVMYVVAIAFLEMLKEVKPIRYIYAIIHLLLFGLVSYEILLYRARGPLLALLFFEVLRFFLMKGFGKKKWFTYLLIGGLTIGDLIFTAIYINLYQIIGDVRMPIFNKRIMSGRQYSWADFWRGFLSRPITGIGSDYEKAISNWSGIDAHNALLSLMAVHGVVLFAVMLYFIIRFLRKQAMDTFTKPIQALLVSGVFMIFVISIFENALYMGPFSNLLVLFALAYNMTKADDAIVEVVNENISKGC